MKYKILLLILLLFPLVTAKANEAEDLLNGMSEKIKDIKVEYEKLLLLKKYPVGSIYMSVYSTNPSELFGGKWERYAQGRTIIGTGSNGTTSYTNGSTGGNSKATLTISNLPSHNHTLVAKGNVTSTFTGKSVKTSSNGLHDHIIDAYRCSEENDIDDYALNNASTAFGGRIFVDTSRIGAYKNTSSQGSHTHSITSKGNVTSTFKGNKGTTSSVGVSSSFSVQNPYIVTYVWKRVA